MKPLHQQGNTRRARLLFQLFPQEKKKCLEHMAQLAIAHIGYAQELRARYPYALVSWQIWFYVVFEVREVLHPTRRWRKWFPRQRFRILFRRINVYYAIHAVNSYAKSPQCRNADFKLAVALLFHQ